MAYGFQLDLFMNPLEEDRVKKKHYQKIKQLVKKTQFTRTEVEGLVLLFHKFVKDYNPKQENMSKPQFETVLHNTFNITDQTLIERIITVICLRHHAASISLELWVTVMWLFFRGTLEEKIEYCFQIYDITGTGIIGRDTMYSLLHNSLAAAEDEVEDTVRDFVEVIFRKLDLDRDGKITKDDYVQSVLKNPQMLECLGQCLPTRRRIIAIATTIFPEPGYL